jgi:hypothetical protein
VFRDRVHAGDWRVEKLDDDGESTEIAIFSGPDARDRAIEYADREYGAFDEIELEPLCAAACSRSPASLPIDGRDTAGSPVAACSQN